MALFQFLWNRVYGRTAEGIEGRKNIDKWGCGSTTYIFVCLFFTFDFVSRAELGDNQWLQCLDVIIAKRVHNK